MTYRRLVTGWLLVGLLGGALAQGCGGSAGPRKPSGSGGTLGTGGKDNGMMTVEPSPQAGSDGESPYDVLCGIPKSGCLPDDVMSCSRVVIAGAGGNGAGPGGTGAGALGGMSTGAEGGVPSQAGA